MELPPTRTASHLSQNPFIDSIHKKILQFYFLIITKTAGLAPNKERGQISHNRHYDQEWRQHQN
ncbi:hypothetical protein [Methylomonas lenta]|uniref:hypothetical protein n=1 Tax=Methylomonas lenta TaxID=980561 RepID=UPI001E510F25|nr:hypothetical protein [Methylomonas lenta]